MLFLKNEPLGAGYLALLDLLRAHCTHFSLVLKRSGVGRSKTAKELEKRLEPFMLLDDEVDRWPGTLLGDGGVARLGVYRIEDGSMAVLGTLTGLYQWRLPEHPEDLAFYAADGSCFFSSTAHEAESMIGSASLSEEQFRRHVPGVSVEWYPGSRP